MTQTITSPKMQANRGRLVDTTHVDTLISNYKKNRWRDNSRKIGKPDSLSAWYGLEELQEFLSLAKQNNADGIKMYFGEYPEDFQENPDFQSRQTVVLVATKRTQSGSTTKNRDIYVHNNGKPQILGFNFGQICPPYCGTEDPSDGTWLIQFETERIGITIINDEQDGLIII